MPPARRLRTRTVLVGLVLPLSLGAGGRPAAAGSAEVRIEWTRWNRFAGLGPVRAVAWDGPRDRVAVGDDDGAWLAAPGEPGRRVVRRGPVDDLAFDAAGDLWVAGEGGLYQLDGSGRVIDRTPGPGASGHVRRLVIRGDRVLCATDAGLHLARRGGRWRRLDGGLPGGAAVALATRDASPPAPRPETSSAGRGAGGDGPPATGDDDAFVLWMVTDGALVSARVRASDAALRVDDVERVTLPQGARDPRDVVTDWPGADVVVLARGALSERVEGRWRTLRPSWPPGAEPLRLGRAAGTRWIATDRGLLVWDGAEVRRADAPLGALAVGDLAGDAERVLAAGARGLWEGRRAARASAPAGPAAGAPAPGAGEPDIVAVQRAALRYLELRPERLRSLRRRAGRRGWLPELSLRGDYGGGRARRRDWDETFSSGEPRLYFDRQRDRDRDFGVFAELTWDLGEVIYHPEEIDVSREAREVIELRDEVLDEITQLYFERRRTRLEWEEAAGDPARAARLVLRIRELGAGLDAWTGGWWSGQPGVSASRAALSSP